VSNPAEGRVWADHSIPFHFIPFQNVPDTYVKGHLVQKSLFRQTDRHKLNRLLYVDHWSGM